MSRIGKKPIPLPSGVKYSVHGNVVVVEGPKGKIEQFIPSGIKLETKDGQVNAVRESDSQAAIHGLTRALIANAVEGVTKGWTKDLDIVGIGYRAELRARTRWSLRWAIRTRSSFRCPRALRQPWMPNRHA
jgi:large subunit ribosomal protein L6